MTNERLRQARQASRSQRVPGEHLSRAELAEQVNSWLATHTGRVGALDAHTIGRYEQGRVKRPGRETRAALRAVLDATDAELGFTPDPRHERLSVALRRPERTDAGALGTAASILAGLRRLEDETSAGDVLPAVLGQRQLVERLATEGDRRAVGLVSEVTQYLGWLHIAGDDYATAAGSLDTAAVSALQANDPLRLATALSFSAYRSLLLGDYRRAGQLNDAARRDTGSDPGLRTYMTVQAAEIAAHEDDHQQAVTLLSTADSLIDKLPPPEELPDSSYWYVPSILLGHKGFVLDALGDVDSARAAAVEALETMPAEWAAAEWAAPHRRLAGRQA